MYSVEGWSLLPINIPKSQLPGMTVCYGCNMIMLDKCCQNMFEISWQVKIGRNFLKPATLKSLYF